MVWVYLVVFMVNKKRNKMRRKDSVSYTLCRRYKRKKLLFKILNICFKNIYKKF
jgi:hypothetical protein